jgi:transcription elongation GreA/GreB family factor
VFNAQHSSVRLATLRRYAAGTPQRASSPHTALAIDFGAVSEQKRPKSKEGTTVDKKSVLTALRSAIEEQKVSAQQALHEALAAIADAPGPMQSHSDTTRYQKSILADSAAKSLQDKEVALKTLDTLLEAAQDTFLEFVGVGAVAMLTNEEDDLELYFLMPHGGGASVPIGHYLVTIISPSSPLGAALMGRRRGEKLKLPFGTSSRLLEIIDIF